MYIGLHVKHPLFLFDFNDNWNFSKDFRKILISWKSVQWKPSCSMQTCGRKDTNKLIVAFQILRTRLRKQQIHQSASFPTTFEQPARKRLYGRKVQISWRSTADYQKWGGLHDLVSGSNEKNKAPFAFWSNNAQCSLPALAAAFPYLWHARIFKWPP
jgi:hypothetical protein